MTLRLNNWLLQSPAYVPLPICAQLGAPLIGCSIRELVSNPAVQSEAVIALKETLDLPILMNAMDLSVEAEAMGCQTVFAEDEIPSIVGRRISDAAQAADFQPPDVGEGRTGVGPQVVRILKSRCPETPVLGCMIGPFSLLIRLVGATETFEITVSDPSLLMNLLEKILPFQIAYARAFQAGGADGVVVAEPAAGLLSPRAMRQFSSDFIRQLVSEVQSDDFVVVLHNCGAKTAHLKPMMETGAGMLHFGSPMHLPTAAAQAAPGLLIGGNLDPYGVFVSSSPEEVRSQTEQLLQSCAFAPHLVPSSGCDLPADTPIENLRAFLEAVRSAPKGAGGG